MSDPPDNDPYALLRAGGATIIKLETEAKRRADAKAEREAKKRQQDEERERERRKTNPRFEDLEDWTEEKLASAILEPTKWLVSDLIPVGVWLCSAAPKIGKSLLMTGLCRAVATGTMFANFKPTTKGPVLYLDLEGSKRRAQKRQATVRGEHDTGSPDFHNFFSFPAADQDGVEELEKAVITFGLKLIVIDVWVGFRSQKKKGEDAYAYDYRSIKPILELASKYELTVILVHHNRKQADADWMAETSGSTGLTGAVDGTMVIKRERGENLATLAIAGRDVDEQELAMRFTGGLWTVIGPAKEFFAGENRRKVHDILSLPINRAGMAVKDLVEDSGVIRSHVNKILKKMLHEGVVTQPRRGWYTLTNPLA